MLFPQINIQQTLGRIGLSYKPMQWDISSKQADVNLQVSQPDVEIHQTPSELDIDQTDAFASEGLLKPLAFLVNQAQQAQQASAQGVEETAQMGDQFARLDKHGSNPFSDWTLRYTNRTVDAEPALVPAPFSVHIHYQPSDLRENVSPGHADLQVAIHPPDVRFVPGVVQAYEEQKSNVTITPPALSSLDYRA